MTPSISVVIACRNEVATLGACLDALRAQSLDARRFEIIVVDGGSTDGSRGLAASTDRVRVLDDGANGPSGARNIGIRAARAPIVAFTDGDCVPATDWLLRITEVFAEDPALTGVGGALRMSGGGRVGALEDMEARAWYRGYITSNVAYKRDALLAVGGFDETLRCAEDYDLAWRLMDAGHRVVHDARPVVTHAPPELVGPFRGYLSKHFWYARCDVPTHVRALARAHAQPGSTAGSARAARGSVDALVGAAWTLAACVGVAGLQPALGAVALAGAAGRAALHVARTTRFCGEAPAGAARTTGIVMARQLARGAGTLVGLSDLARPSTRARLRAPLPTPIARAVLARGLESPA